MLLGKDGEHLSLNGLHLVVELFETCHLALVLMYLGLQRVIVHLDQRHVNVEGLVPRRQELVEIVITVVSDTKVIVPGSCMNLAPLCRPLRRELPQCVWVGGHVDQNVLGRDLLFLIIGDGEGDVHGALIELEEVGDGRRTVACLYPDRVCLPRVVELDRALFCISTLCRPPPCLPQCLPRKPTPCP